MERQGREGQEEMRNEREEGEGEEMKRRGEEERISPGKQLKSTFLTKFSNLGGSCTHIPDMGQIWHVIADKFYCAKFHRDRHIILHITRTNDRCW